MTHLLLNSVLSHLNRFGCRTKKSVVKWFRIQKIIMVQYAGCKAKPLSFLEKNYTSVSKSIAWGKAV